MKIELEHLNNAANQARGLAIDAIAQCKSGHLGLPLGAAEVGAALFGYGLQYNPQAPRWINRDRFVLSAGHGSMFLYAWLYLSGYDLTLENIRNFRVLHSPTPGHPEFGETPGVEATTGPLGQGVSNAVGYAVSQKMAAHRWNTPEHTILDYHVVCLAGDGCIQEGIAQEASAFAGHFGLDNFILLYDANDITLDAPAEATQSEDTAARYESYGFEVWRDVDGYDIENFLQILAQAKSSDNGKPKLILLKTLIGKGIAEVAGTAAAHGEGGIKFADAARQKLGLPAETFFVSEEVRTFFAQRLEERRTEFQAWEERFDKWAKAHPEKSEELSAALGQSVPTDLLERIPPFPEDKALATRASCGEALQPVAEAMPLFISGSADLHGSTKNYISSSDDFTRDNSSGRNIRFGIREHAMAGICNGIAYDGFLRPSCATFMVFSDYARPSMRLAALAGLPVVYFYTHDSVGVGEDGPTHQPIEAVSALRLIPNLDLIRPADAEETAGALAAALQRIDGPTVLSLSRQNLPPLNSIPRRERREGVYRGAYIARKETAELRLILIATGSELHLALEAAEKIGNHVRVVSLPCWERFARQSQDYRNKVLPTTCPKRIAIEAGVSALWEGIVGLEGRVIGIDRFGLSAPGDQVLTELGISTDAIVAVANELLS